MKSTKIKVFRTSTIALSLDVLLKGQLKYLNKYFDVTAISGADKHLEIVKEREGVAIRNVKMAREISPLQDLKSLWQLYKLFKSEKPQIVHSITPKAGLLTMLAGKLAGVPIRIHTFTGLVFPSKQGKLQQLLIKMDQLLCWAATHIVPEGNGVKQDLMQYRITNKPLELIANGNVNGVDLGAFNRSHFFKEELSKLKKSIGLADEKFTFVFVGRLVRDKGINELIEAFSQLDVTKVQLLLVGPYEDKDPLFPETIDTIKRANNIFEVGFQSDVRPYFALSDCLAFPSYREGFPNVVIQAGAMELPSIVTDISGANEIIVQGQNGLIIPKQNVLELNKAMHQIMDDKLLYNHLQSNARHLIESRFDQHRVWSSTLEFYNQIIKNKELVLH